MNIRSVQEYIESDNDQGVERTYKYYDKESMNIHTDKQEVDIIVSSYWKKMLFLDGTLQSTTRDEVIYHNALVHPLLDSLLVRDRILILGGGEGATAREVLRWQSVKSVLMVDYDKELVEYMKKHGSDWSAGAFQDPRLSLFYDDAWKFIKNDLDVEAVIIDLTDPDLKINNWNKLLKGAMNAVRKAKGGFVLNAGLYLPWDTAKLNELVNIVKDICLVNYEFRYYVYTTYVPSFNGEWSFIVVAHKQKFMTEPEFSTIIPAWIRRGIKMLPDELLKPFTMIPQLHKLP